MNFEETNASEARYILAFLSGASYANHGEVRPIAAKTYIFTPAGVSLSGAEIRDDLAQNGVTLEMKNVRIFILEKLIFGELSPTIIC